MTTSRIVSSDHNGEFVDMKLYRYMKTHAYETLRDAKFKITPPSDFNDRLECKAKVEGEPSVESLKKRYGPEDGFIENASRAGIPPERILAALNSGRLKIPTPEDYAKTAQGVVGDDEIAMKNLRILCLSDAGEHPETDRRMWRRYASFSGVRIGLDFTYAPKSDRFAFYPVRYQDEQASFDLSKDDCSGKTLDVVSMITTKLKQWEPEREYRLITRPEYCEHDGKFDFLSFNPDIVQSVDIGFKMRLRESKGLVKMIRGKYPNVKICRMSFDEMTQEIIYVPWPK